MPTQLLFASTLRGANRLAICSHVGRLLLGQDLFEVKDTGLEGVTG